MPESVNATLVSAVIVVLALAVILAWLILGFDWGEENLAEERCRESIREHSLLVTLSSEQAQRSIECEPHEVTIDNSDEQEAYAAVASELAFCWERWQRGELQLFKGNGTFCNPCSRIRFTEPTEMDGLFDYLNGDEAGYHDALFPYATAGFDVMRSVAGYLDYSLHGDREYVVLFYTDKGYTLQSIRQAMQEDPARAAQVLDDIGRRAAQGGAMGAAGSVIVLIGVGVTGTGVGAIPGLAVLGAYSAIGAMAGGGTVFIGNVPVPEWYSMVLIGPHEASYYEQLGCTGVFQSGAQGLNTP